MKQENAIQANLLINGQNVKRANTFGKSDGALKSGKCVIIAGMLARIIKQNKHKKTALALQLWRGGGKMTDKQFLFIKAICDCLEIAFPEEIITQKDASDFIQKHKSDFDKYILSAEFQYTENW